MQLCIIGKNSFVGKYFLEKYKTENTKEICLLTNKLEEISFSNTNSIIHLSALVHQMKGAPEEKYFQVNSDLAYNTAKKAKTEGVFHFIYMSTVKVYGEFTSTGESWNENTKCNPIDTYRKSKLEGEQRIKDLEDDNFVVSIIRTPIVYGPGVKANMFNLIRLIEKSPFVPLGNIKNLHSMTFVGNLCQLIHSVIEQKKSGIFLASDEYPISTSDLVKEISKASGKKNNIIPIPTIAQKLIKTIKPNIHQRLFGNLVVNDTQTSKILNYSPEYSFEQGNSEMVEWDKKNKSFMDQVKSKYVLFSFAR